MYVSVVLQAPLIYHDSPIIYYLRRFRDSASVLSFVQYRHCLLNYDLLYIFQSKHYIYFTPHPVMSMYGYRHDNYPDVLINYMVSLNLCLLSTVVKELRSEMLCHRPVQVNLACLTYRRRQNVSIMIIQFYYILNPEDVVIGRLVLLVFTYMFLWLT